jgi:hypothetical protein
VTNLKLAVGGLAAELARFGVSLGVLKPIVRAFFRREIETGHTFSGTT